MKTNRAKRWAPLPAVLLTLTCTLAMTAHAETSLLLSLQAPMPEAEAADLFGGYPFVSGVKAAYAVNGETRLLVVRLTEGTDVAAAIEDLAGGPFVELVQENHPVSLDALPPYEETKAQWALDNEGALGFEAGMHPDAAIAAFDAWQLGAVGPGDRPVRVAVIDSGVDLDHPDLAGQLEPGVDLVDEHDIDGPQDTDGHGTRVSGIIAAAWNGEGIAGVCPQCRILPVRVTSGPEFDVASLVAGIQWALDSQADVINISAGADAWSQSSPVLHQVVRRAVDEGVPVVAAAGNAGHLGLDLPAAYPETIAVGSVNRRGRRAAQSNQAPELDLVAPGDDIFSTIPFSDPDAKTYEKGSGTSFAAPHVTGIIGLMLSQDPWLTPAELRERLIRAARDTNSQPDGSGVGPDTELGWGVPNAADALLDTSSVGMPSWLHDLNAEPPSTLSNDAYHAGRVHLAWRADPDASSYRIEREDALSGQPVTVGFSAGAPEGHDAVAPSGQQSRYRVVAVNPNGEGGSPWVVGPYVPSRPWPIAASDGDATDGVVVHWSPVSGADHYRVYASMTRGGRPSLVATTADTEILYADAVPKIVYWYWVSAVTPEGQEGPLSEPEMGHRGALPVTAPENLSASTNNSSGVLLRWDPVPNAVRYWVYRATSANGPWSLREYPGATTWLDTATTTGTTYWYRVRAQSAAGFYGPFSDPVSGKRGSSYTRYRIIWIGPGRYIKVWY
jgi:subtilisin family serine protease